MTEDKVVFVKKVAKSGRGFLVWLPKDVTQYMNISEEDTVEIVIRKLKKKGGKK